MIAALVLTCVAAAVAVVALCSLLIDRSAQAKAWRQIAEERRWNHERVSPGRG